MAGSDPFHIQAVRRVIEVNGRPATVFGLRQPDGTPGLVKSADSEFRLRLTNLSGEPTLIHWHGLLPPYAQDGVPWISQPPLVDGGTYEYRFPQRRAGTFWMHSHLGLQEQALMAAPLIVRDPAEAGLDEQEAVILLHDFSFRSPEEILSGLTGGADGAATLMSHMQASARYAGAGGTSGAGGSEAIASADLAAAVRWVAGAGMTQVYANDVEYDAYLANDRTLSDPEVVSVEPGGRVRLRVINAASATNFHLDLGALDGFLLAVDGEPVEPIRVRRVPLAIAQRVDIRVALPAGQGAYPILALREAAVEQTGMILATPRATVLRVADSGAAASPHLDLSFESELLAGRPLTQRRPDRTLAADLTLDAAGYEWGINGIPFGKHRPLEVVSGQRVETVMRNFTEMAHPMHLHGHRFQVTGIGERTLRGAVRDTVIVPSGETVRVAFDAENWGPWVFHCHNLYHMAAGMMTTLEYEGIH